MASKGVLLLTSDPGAERTVGDALSAEGSFEIVGHCRTVNEVAARLERGEASAVLVDIDAHRVEQLDAVIARFPETRFVLLSSNPSQELLLEAMEIGARNVLAKNAIPATLTGVLHRVLPNGAGRRGARGLAVSVLSASGGCGATLLAANLANELRLESKSDTLVIDLDCFCGAVSSYLGLEHHYGLEAVLGDTTRLDSDLIRSSAAIYDQSLYVLQCPSAAHSLTMNPLQYENLPTLLGAAKSAFKYTVLDAPRLPIHITAQISEASNLTLIPFQLTVLGIRAAKNLITALESSGCPPEQIVPVATRFRKRRTMIALDEACRALGRSEVPRISNDFRSAVESINFGKPLAQSAPRSALRHDIKSLAVRIHTAHSQAKAPVLTS